MKTKEELKEYLQQNSATVVFTKADGSERTLKCTLKESVLPVVEQTETKKVRVSNPDTLSVWDIENEGWRSFRLDSIIHFHTA
jgi:hypothetical protein